MKLSYVLITAILLLTGCAGLPSSGPKSSDIRTEYEQSNGRSFELIPVTTRTLAILKRQTAPTLAQSFGDYAPTPQQTIGVGDGLAITIWEAGQGGLFAPPTISLQGGLAAQSGSRGVTIPEQIVNHEGRITVPFVGTIPVLSRTLFEIQQQIETGLTGKAAQPQVLVTLTRNASNTVTVLGEVVSGARLPLSERGDKLLDVLASAGGIKAPVFETYVQVTRGERTVTQPFQKILHNPQENIYLRSGDLIAITRKPQTFTALGATGRNARVPFEATELSLAEGLAKSGGLIDNLSDARGIYLFRYEKPSLVKTLSPATQAPSQQGWVPVVYQFDLAQAGSYFLAQDFELNDRDIVYVAGARANELQKFLMMLGLITQPILSGAVISDTIQN